jgi:hypothetical protein
MTDDVDEIVRTLPDGCRHALKRAAPLPHERDGRVLVSWNAAPATMRALRTRKLIFNRPQRHLTPFGLLVRARLKGDVS